jgi:N-acetylmuramoyl-L-alanine amidase/Putative peptidoglycan binding domain
MSLNRVWLASPNYSGRGGSKVRLIVLHTAEGATTYQSLGSYFANPSSQVSSHVGIDDTPGTVGEYVSRSNKAWTAANANPYAIQAELCAFAKWTAADWATHPTMLDNTAQWVAEEAANFGIPLVALTAAQAQGGVAGVCQHVDLGVAGGNHWDCGSGFPMAQVIAQAGGSAPPPPAPAPGTAPAWPGVYLQDYTEDPSVSTWQGQMVARGWTLTVDGCYGPESAGVCRQFQQEKGLGVDAIVGPETWSATWTAPVT